MGEVIAFRYHYDPKAPSELKESAVTLKPQSGVMLDEYVKTDGFIRAIYVNIPEPAKNMVVLRIFVDGKQIFPREGFYSGEGVMFVPVYFEVSKGSKITLDIRNLDNVEHRASVMVVIYPALEVQL